MLRRFFSPDYFATHELLFDVLGDHADAQWFRRTFGAASTKRRERVVADGLNLIRTALRPA